MTASLLWRMSILDAFAAGIWLVANAVMVISLRRLHRRFFPREDNLHCGLFCSLLFVATLILSGTLLGAMGLLTAFRQQFLAGAILVFAVRSLSTRKPISVPVAEDLTRSDVYARWAGYAAMTVLLVHSVLNGVLKFPKDFDSLWYHMPLIDSWLQTGSLYVPQCARWYFPANSELLGVWATAGCSGDFFVPLNNVPVVVLWGFATLAIFQALGVSGSLQYIGTAGVLAVYTTVHETIDASNDLMVVSCFSAALAWILKDHLPADQKSGRIYIALVGVSVGLLAGTKHFALGYAFGAVCLLLLSGVLKNGVVSAFKSLMLGCLWSTPFWIYWYGRNWWFTGFSLYPVGASEPAGEMAYPNLWSTTIIGNESPLVLQALAGAVWRECGPLHTICIALIPFALTGLLITAYHKRASSFGMNFIHRVCLLGAAVAGCLLIWLVTPFCVEDEPGSLNHLLWAYTPVRYGLCFLSMSVIAGVTFIANLNRAVGLFRILLLTTVGIQWMRLCVNHEDQTQPLMLAMLTMDCLAVGWILSSLYRKTHFQQISVITLSTAAMMIATAWLSNSWHTGLAAHFRAYNGGIVIPLDSSFADRRTILVFDQRPYPYFGSARQNQVIQPAGFQDVAHAKELIDVYNVDYVVTRRRPEYTVYPYEQAWSQMHQVSGMRVIDQMLHVMVYAREPEKQLSP